MKKKLLLLLLPLTLLCGCNNSNSMAKKHYLKGDEAVPVKQELSNKLKTATESFSWKGFEESLELSFSGSVDTLNYNTDTYTKSNFSASLKESTKVAFDENELKAANPNYEKAVKLESKIGLEYDTSTTEKDKPVSAHAKLDATAKYGYATIKPDYNKRSISSDFLFIKATYSTKEGEDSQTLTRGVLGNGFANEIVNAINNPTSNSSSSIVIDQGNLVAVLDSLKDYLGYAKSNNKYYVSLDLKGLNNIASAITSENVTLKGNIYAEVAFTEDGNFSSFNLDINNVSVSSSSQSGFNSTNISLNGKCSIKEFKGDVSAPTQEEIDALGYNKISLLETTY